MQIPVTNVSLIGQCNHKLNATSCQCMQIAFGFVFLFSLYSPDLSVPQYGNSVSSSSNWRKWREWAN